MPDALSSRRHKSLPALRHLLVYNCGKPSVKTLVLCLCGKRGTGYDRSGQKCPSRLVCRLQRLSGLGFSTASESHKLIANRPFGTIVNTVKAYDTSAHINLVRVAVNARRLAFLHAPLA